MKKEAFSKYIYCCRKAEVPDNISLGVFLKHIGMKKTSEFLIKQSGPKTEAAKAIIKKTWPWLGGTALGSYLYGLFSANANAEREAENKKLRAALAKHTGIGGIDNSQLLGGVAGAGLGYLAGPKIFTSLDKPNARILGGLGGGLLGAVIGTSFNKK